MEFETKTKVSLVYAGDTKTKLAQYSVAVEVKPDESDDKYYELAMALEPIIDADGREVREVMLTVTQTVEMV